MVKIVTAGIGFGSKSGVERFSLLEPDSLREYRYQLMEEGINVRDVIGFIPFLRDEPSKLVMMNNSPNRLQGETTDANKGTLGNITPPGGKIDGIYKVISDKGIISIDMAFGAGFVSELDELGVPGSLALKLINRIQGLPHNGIFKSPDNVNLYLDGEFVREFRYVPYGGATQLVRVNENFGSYAPLENILVSYAIGLDRNDKKNGSYTATGAANVWIPVSREEFQGLGRFVEGHQIDDISGLVEVDLRDFGSKCPTTVSNMIATALLIDDPENYATLTGQERPENFPKISDMEAFDHTRRFERLSIKDIVGLFYEEI